MAIFKKSNIQSVGQRSNTSPAEAEASKQEFLKKMEARMEAETAKRKQELLDNPELARKFIYAGPSAGSPKRRDPRYRHLYPYN